MQNIISKGTNQAGVNPSISIQATPEGTKPNKTSCYMNYIGQQQTANYYKLCKYGLLISVKPDSKATSLTEFIISSSVSSVWNFTNSSSTLAT